MNTKKRLEELERRKAQQREQVVLTVIYDDGARGKSYVLTANGFREATENEVQKCHH